MKSKKSKHKREQPQPKPVVRSGQIWIIDEKKYGPDDFVWGAENLGALVNRTAAQFWYGVSTSDDGKKKPYYDVDHTGRLIRSTPRRLGLVPKEGAS